MTLQRTALVSALLSFGVAAAGVAQVVPTFGNAVEMTQLSQSVRAEGDFDAPQFTFEAIAVLRGVGPIGYGGIACYGRDADASWEILVQSDGALFLQLNWGKSNTAVVNTPPGFVVFQSAPDGEPMHLAVTYDGAVVRFSVMFQFSQASVFSVPLNVPVSSGGPGAALWLGVDNPGDDEYVNLVLDEVRIWDHARSPDDISCGAFIPAVGDESGLIACYHFDEPKGQVVLDSSPRGQHGTLGASAAAGPDDPGRRPSPALFSPIHVLTWPQPATACYSGEASFSVAPCSRYEYTIQWYRNGVALSDGPGVAGADAATLELSALGPGDSFSYYYVTVRTVVHGQAYAISSTASPLVVCLADFTCDGVVNSTDVSEFINAWFEDQVAGTVITDIDRNGVVNSTDVSEFINLWFVDSIGCV